MWVKGRKASGRLQGYILVLYHTPVFNLLHCFHFTMTQATIKAVIALNRAKHSDPKEIITSLQSIRQSQLSLHPRLSMRCKARGEDVICYHVPASIESGPE